MEHFFGNTLECSLKGDIHFNPKDSHCSFNMRSNEKDTEWYTYVFFNAV